MLRNSQSSLGLFLLFLLVVCVAACSPAGESTESTSDAAEASAEPDRDEDVDPERAAVIAIREMDPDGDDPAAVLSAIDEFDETYPESRSRTLVRQRAIAAAAAIDPESPAVLERVERYTDAYLENGDAAMAYNGAARALFEAEAHLDAAAAYADKALAELGDEGSDRRRGTILQTVARARFIEGNNGAAIETQRQALELRPDNSSSHEALGEFLLADGEIAEAGHHFAWAALTSPDSGDSLRQLRELAASQAENTDAADEYLSRVTGETADAMLESSDDPAEMKVTLAKSFTKIGVLTDRALRYAQAAVEESGPEAGINAYVAARVAYAQVQENMGEYAEALAALKTIEPIANSYDLDFHLTRGRSLEALGREDEAIEAYLEGSPERAQIRERLEPLWEEHRAGEDLDAVIEARREALENWHPDGTFATPDDWSGKVVLAELFTGSECGPCAGADLAYDGLISYYPRTALAVLENHVHIPRPDPMVNEDVVARLDYYGRDVVLGAPTSIVDGTDDLVGGGSRSGGRSRFNVYSWSIERAMADVPAVEIELEGERSGRTVRVAAAVAPRPGLEDYGDLRLRVALAEKLVHYEGSNGVGEHRMVTRTFIGGADGFELGADGRASVQEEVDLTDLQNRLLAYLTDFEENPPERHSEFEGFSEKKHEIDIEALVLVAFVQNDATYEVLQAQVFELR